MRQVLKRYRSTTFSLHVRAMLGVQSRGGGDEALGGVGSQLDGRVLFLLLHLPSSRAWGASRMGRRVTALSHCWGQHLGVDDIPA